MWRIYSPMDFTTVAFAELRSGPGNAPLRIDKQFDDESLLLTNAA